jgi:hypothetical protein
LFIYLLIYWYFYSSFIYRCSQLLRLYSVELVNNEFGKAVEGSDRGPI